MKKIKLIIAGGRDFNNYELLKEYVDIALSNLKNVEIEIVSGTAKGADKLGEYYAKEKGYNIAYFKPDWNTHSKLAGFIRNEDMAKYATHLICFWNGQSKGTKHMIEIAKKYNVKTIVIKYTND